MSATEIHWLAARISVARDLVRDSAAFWAAVTGSATSARAATTLLPPAGSPYLSVEAGPRAVGVDLFVSDPASATADAERLGARADPAGLRTPGGLALRLQPATAGRRRPPPQQWPGGQHSLLDQLCLDLPSAGHAAEVAFWAALTGWPLRPGRLDCFSFLARPPQLPLRLLLQRLDEPAGPARAHLDLACDDVDSEVSRHQCLGAVVLRRTPVWTTLRGGDGGEYCVTSRDPLTGELAGPRR